MKIEVSLLDALSIMVLVVSVDVKQQGTELKCRKNMSAAFGKESGKGVGRGR